MNIYHKFACLTVAMGICWTIGGPQNWLTQGLGILGIVMGAVMWYLGERLDKRNYRDQFK